MSRGRVLMTAEPYGFGPSSKALAIAREIVQTHATRVDFAGTGTALSAAQREEEIFGAVVPSGRYEADALLDAVHGYRLVISVMEPSLAFAAAAAQVPCLYVDSLFWMWDWSDRLAEVDGPAERLLRRLTDTSPRHRRDALGDALALPMHEAQYVAHRAATRVLYQRYGDSVALAPSRAREACAAAAVGAIVDPVTEADVLGGAGPRLVVSVSGLSNELTAADLATGWARVVVDVLDEAVRGTAFEGPSTRVGGNADILSALPGGSRTVDSRPWRSHREFMLDLSRATVLAAPPGITSIAESWSVGVPFFALPSQHYAHASILERLRAGDAATFPAIEIDVERAGQDITDATAAVLGATITELRAGGRVRTAAVEHLHEFLQALDGGRAGLVARQGERLARLFGDADGAATVAREAQSLC